MMALFAITQISTFNLNSVVLQRRCNIRHNQHPPPRNQHIWRLTPTQPLRDSHCAHCGLREAREGRCPAPSAFFYLFGSFFLRTLAQPSSSKRSGVLFTCENERNPVLPPSCPVVLSPVPGCFATHPPYRIAFYVTESPLSPADLSLGIGLSDVEPSRRCAWWL